MNDGVIGKVNFGFIYGIVLALFDVDLYFNLSIGALGFSNDLFWLLVIELLEKELFPLLLVDILFSGFCSTEFVRVRRTNFGGSLVLRTEFERRKLRVFAPTEGLQGNNYLYNERHLLCKHC